MAAGVGESRYIYLLLRDSSIIEIYDLKEKKGKTVTLDFKITAHWVGCVHVRQYLFLGFWDQMKRVDPKGKVDDFAPLRSPRTLFAMAYWAHRHSVLAVGGYGVASMS